MTNIENKDQKPIINKAESSLSIKELALIDSWYDTANRPEDVPEGEVFDAWTLRILDQGEWGSLSNKEKSLYYWAWASLAPTTHNTVPQKARIQDDGSMDIYVDKKWILPASDPEGRQAMVSMGAVIESVVQASEAYGVSSKIELDQVEKETVQPVDEVVRKEMEEGSDLVKVATVEFEESPTLESNLTVLELMKKRKNMRARFKKEDLDSQATNYITQVIDSTHLNQFDAQLHMVTGLPIAGLAQFHQTAIQTAVSDSNFKAELGDWMVSNEESVKNRGMRGREFGLDNIGTKDLINGMKDETEQSADTIHAFSRQEKSYVDSASAVLMVTTQNQSVEDWIKAGRLYSSVILQLSSLGYDNSMQAALTETSFFPIKIANATVKGTVLRTPRRHIQAVFRVGKTVDKSDLKRKHSSRPKLQALLT